MTDPFDTLESDMDRAIGHRFVDVAARYMERTRDGTGAVSTGLTAADIAKRFAQPMPSAGIPVDDVLRRLEDDVLGDANRLMHPMYMGHQVAPPLAAAVWTDAVVGALNNSGAVWEMSPTLTPLETQVVRWMCELAGYGAESGGTFTSGGTEATFTALLAARAAVLPDAWENGIDAATAPVVLCGEHAHYAVTRAVAELGLGLKRAIAVPSRDYRMDPDALKVVLAHLKKQKTKVMAVVATAGSTSTGSFDDLNKIADQCDKHDIWLHVDGAHGASALLSKNHRGRLGGIDRARSIAWDPHKMMLMPLATGMLLVRREADLESAFAQAAPYLFHAAEGGRVWDQGRRSFLCSRRTDALKLWVALQRHGSAAFGAIYDRLCETTLKLHGILSANPAFETFHAPETNILCFRWVGKHAREDFALDEINRELRERYNRSGTGWITSTMLDGRRVLRVTLMNPRTREEHLRRMIDALAGLAGTA